MTIEISPPASKASKPASASGAHGTKTLAKAPTDAAADAGATGFMAILGALDDGGAQAAPALNAPDAAQTDALGTQATTPLDATDPANLNSTAALVLDATALLQQNPQIAAAQAAAMAAQAALRAASGSGANAKDAKSDAVGMLGQDGKSAPLVLEAQVAQPDVGLQQGDSSLASAAGRARMDAAAAQPSADQASDAPLEAMEPRTPSGQRHGAHAKAGKDGALQAPDSSTTVAASPTVTDRAEAKDAKLMAALEQVKAATAARSQEPVLAPLVAKAEKSQTERIESREKASAPTYGGTTVGVSGPEFSAAVDPSSALAPEMQVAEQVTYWVSQNVQNAEMKLDGLGQSPVEVSISVQGNEAQISFRTDEAQARGVLEGAGAHLKDMLQREGMILTGVSVGSSGGRDASGSGGDRRGRQSARQAVIAPLEAAKAPHLRQTGMGTGRSVDLFV